LQTHLGWSGCINLEPESIFLLIVARSILLGTNLAGLI
jgi:hypothetical protein